jgi:RNA polymerase sigma factor (TIGR02999 family)
MDRTMDPSPVEPDDDVTDLLEAWSQGNEAAFDALVSAVYDDLCRIAHRHLLGERPDHTLDTQALVHESYLHLAGKPGKEWRNRAQFFAVASKAMRRLLVDHARRRKAEKRGGEATRVTWSGDFGATDADVEEVLALDDALERLGGRDHRLLMVVECRFFGGMTVPETADALGVSTRSVERDWARARTYLYRAIGPGQAEPRG